MWYNVDNDDSENIARGMGYSTSADLTDFGRLVLEDPAVGLRTLGRRATIF